MSYSYSAGIYEQTSSGWGLVTWSRHRSEAAARAAARRYLARLQAPTGGAYSWSAWWRRGDEPAVEVSRRPDLA